MIYDLNPRDNVLCFTSHRMKFLANKCKGLPYLAWLFVDVLLDIGSDAFPDSIMVEDESMMFCWAGRPRVMDLLVVEKIARTYGFPKGTHVLESGGFSFGTWC